MRKKYPRLNVTDHLTMHLLQSVHHLIKARDVRDFISVTHVPDVNDIKRSLRASRFVCIFNKN